jgi:hypothetical protein
MSSPVAGVPPGPTADPPLPPFPAAPGRRRRRRPPGWAAPPLFVPRGASSRPNWKCRVRRDPDLPKHVRRLAAGTFQARPWTGPGKADNWNLGLFRAEDYGGDPDAACAAAGRAALEFLKRMRPGADPWAVTKEIMALEHRPRRGPDGRVRYAAEPYRGVEGCPPVVRADLLPRGVVRLGGGGFGVLRRVPGRPVEGPFATPEAAWAAARAGLRQ